MRFYKVIFLLSFMVSFLCASCYPSTNSEDHFGENTETELNHEVRAQGNLAQYRFSGTLYSLTIEQIIDDLLKRKIESPRTLKKDSSSIGHWQRYFFIGWSKIKQGAAVLLEEEYIGEAGILSYSIILVDKSAAAREDALCLLSDKNPKRTTPDINAMRKVLKSAIIMWLPFLEKYEVLLDLNQALKSKDDKIRWENKEYELFSGYDNYGFQFGLKNSATEKISR